MGAPSEPRPARSRRCPRCGRPGDPRYRPFCSAGCRDRDLLDWLEGRYAVPAVEAEDEEEGLGEAERVPGEGPLPPRRS